MRKKSQTPPITSDPKMFIPGKKEVPIQQISPREPINEKTVREAVKELNPDQNSMGERG